MWTCVAYIKVYERGFLVRRTIRKQFDDLPTAHRWAQAMVETGPAHMVIGPERVS